MKNSLVFALFVCAAFVGCSDDAPVLLNNSVKSDAGGMPDSSDTTGQTNNVVFPGDDAGQADQGECSPDREDEPDPDFFDANCDGLDGDESQSVFVATYGDDANPGTKGLPKASVAAAVTTAAAEGKSWVLVAESFYDGSVELADGVSIAGGYGFNWKRDGRAKTTFRMGSPVITGVNIQQRTILMGFEVLGGSAPPGMTAAAVYLQASPGVVLLDLRITGGKGGDGMRGSAGSTGETGNTGVKGGNAPPDSGGFLGLDCINQSNPPATGAGGEPACGSEDGRGAKGGSAGFNSASGSKGTNGTAGAVGGAGGTPGSPGLEGSNGSSGTTGAPGVGGIAEGSFVDGQWLGQDGSSGESGTAGEGGAGGGGGGGGDKSDGLFNGCGSWGGAGGGGGSGGCGGIGGGGGQSGGASVGVLLLNSDIEIIDCTIIGGLGGRGGDGGDGGEGGMGGAGGGGGNLEENSGKGAKGGIGGRGGRGGQGGGGAGGPSIGLFSSGPLSKAPQASTVMQGEGGTGGAAGGAAGRGADGIAEAVRMP